MKTIVKWLLVSLLVLGSVGLTGCATKMSASYEGSLFQRQYCVPSVRQYQPVQQVMCAPVQCVPVEPCVDQEPPDNNYRYEGYSFGVPRSYNYYGGSYYWGSGGSHRGGSWNSYNARVRTPNPPGCGQNTQGCKP